MADTKLEIAEKRSKIWAMRVQGHTHEEISRALGIPQNTVRYHVRQAVALIDTTKYLEDEMNVSLERLDMLFKAYLPRALGIGKYDGAAMDRDDAALCLKIDESRRKLLGLDPAKRVDIRAYIMDWAEREGFDPIDVIDVVSDMLPQPGVVG